MANVKSGQTADKMIATLVAQRQGPTPTVNDRAQIAALAPVAGLLFLSGMCSLIFQVSWFREFRLVFGASAAASSAVVAVFMGGLGIGNAVWGRLADRARTPLALYAALELSIALTVALGPLLIGLLHGLYTSLGGQLALGGPLATVVRLLISVLVLGIPTFLMGGTVPAAVRAVTDHDDRQRRSAALLYGVNTLGAVAGAFGSTFFALEYFGTRETLWLACLINTFTAVSALTVARKGFARASGGQQMESSADEKHVSGLDANNAPWAKRIDEPAEICDRSLDDRRHGRNSKRHARRRGDRTAGRQHAFQSARMEERSTEVQARPARFLANTIYAVAGIVGFAFFLMELVWYRMLGPILGGTTFTFGLILAVALMGIGLGGTAYALFCRRMPVSLHSLALSCVMEACCIAVPFALGDRLAVLAAHFRDAAASNFLGELGGWAVITSIVVLPAALVSGVQFSMLVSLLGQGDKDIGKQMGFTFSFNTLGAILGALAGGFGLLPLLSAPGVWRSVVALLAVGGASVSVYAWRLARRRILAIATLGAGIVAIGLIACPGPTAVWRHGAVGAGRGGWTRILADPNSLRDWENSVRRSVLWEADGIESTVAIVGSDSLAFYVNGMCDGNAIADAGTQIMLGLIGAALHPQPRSAFVVGLGTGETAGWLAEVSSIERVDVVELEPSVQEMTRRCSVVNHDVLANPKVRLTFNDAREVLRTTTARYDLIVCEPSNPYRNGIANLFTREFYLAGRDRLNEGGMFAQWIQAYEIDEPTMRTVFATLKSVFSHVELWQTKGGDMVLVGSDRRPEYSASKLRTKLATEPFASALCSAWHTADLEGLFSHYMGGEALIDHFVGEGAASINTDDHNEIEYACARNLGRNTWDAQGTLYRKSVAIGDQRPPADAGAVDWQLVRLGRQWDAAVRDGKELSAEDLGLEGGVGDKVLERYVARDAWGTLNAWEALPKSASCLTELAVVAHLYAEAGNSQAEPLIERLRDRMPTEAELLGGILAYKQRRTVESGERLATALGRFRSDPWVLEHILTKSFDAAISVAKSDPAQAPKLLHAFAEPFPVDCADENRRATAGVIAEQLSPATVAQFVESFEPHVPWSKRFLAYRLKAYEKAGHPGAAQARQDLQEFVREAAKAPTLSGSVR